MQEPPEQRFTFDKSNSLLCNADSFDKRLHRDFGVAMAGFNVINEFAVESTSNQILVIRVTHNNIKSVHGDLINQQPEFENLKYNLSILFWDIETTSSEEKESADIKTTAIPYMISAIYRDRNNKIFKHLFCTKFFEPKQGADYVVHFKNTELEMIQSFGKLIKHFRPDIVSGFNDFSFDWYVIINRLIELDVERTGEILAKFYRDIDICYDARNIKSGIIDPFRQTRAYIAKNPELTQYCQMVTVESCRLFTK